MNLVKTLAYAAIIGGIGNWQACSAKPANVLITVDKPAIGVGQSITLNAKAFAPDGMPAVGWTLLPTSMVSDGVLTKKLMLKAAHNSRFLCLGLGFRQ